jgi:hypothetical protein
MLLTAIYDWAEDIHRWSLHYKKPPHIAEKIIENAGKKEKS